MNFIKAPLKLELKVTYLTEFFVCGDEKGIFIQELFVMQHLYSDPPISRY